MLELLIIAAFASNELHRMIWYDLAVFTIIAHPQELSRSKGSNRKVGTKN